MSTKKSTKKKSTNVHKAIQSDQIVVNGYSEQWLRQDFDWVYPQEIAKKGQQVQFGSVVEICTEQQQCLGMGIYATGEVAVFRYSTHKVALDKAFFLQRFTAALQRRKIPQDTSAWRMVHGANDDLPGLVIEVWGNCISIILSSESLVPWLKLWLEVLEAVLDFDIAVGHVRLPNGKQKYLGILKGTLPEQIEVQELGVQYWVSPQKSKDAGLFCDMRGLRQFLSDSWTDKTFLNLFCYTGAFSVSAAHHGAKVCSVDLSKQYLQRAQDNFELNGLNIQEHDFLEGDCFQILDRLRRKQELFDVVLADPPSFSHSAAGVWAVQKDMKRLVIACLRVLRPGGRLIISTNHGKMAPREFAKAIQDAARKEKRRLKLQLNYAPGSDFPAALYFPTARYLKCWVMEA